MAWMDRQDPARKASRNAKMVETRRKKYLRRKREEAGASVEETATDRWHTYAELAQVTGYSAARMLQVTQERSWPIKQSRHVGGNRSPLHLVYGDASTLPVKDGYRVARQEPTPGPAPVLILAPPVAEQIASGRWYTYAELARYTGYSRYTVGRNTKARKWPMKRLPRVGHAGHGLCAVFGDASTLPCRPMVAAPAPALRTEVSPPAAVPRLSFWQRIKGWFA
jgi:alkylated DNA nucleotide flippase Atl1